MMIGLAVGLHNSNAIIFGLIAHMLNAITIGAVFCVCSALHPMLNLTSIWKGIFAGGVTGLEVFAIFFMPITLFIILPAMGVIGGGSNETVTAIHEREIISVLKSNISLIMWGSLGLHVLYGSTMGFFSSLILREEYRIPTKTVNH